MLMLFADVLLQSQLSRCAVWSLESSIVCLSTTKHIFMGNLPYSNYASLKGCSHIYQEKPSEVRFFLDDLIQDLNLVK